MKRRQELVDLLRRRLVAGLHLGLLGPGSRLPSAHQLVRDLGQPKPNQRAIVTAYRELERDGLVEVRARSGVYVARHALSTGWLLPAFQEWVVDTLVTGLWRGVAAPELPGHLQRCLATVRLRALCIEDNADQLRYLCTELQRDYGVETQSVELNTLASSDLRPALEWADVLVTTSFHADAIRRVATPLEKPWIVIVLRKDFVVEVTRHLALGPVYFVVADARYAERLRAIYGRVRGARNLRPLVVGRDDVVQIPSEAPVYVTKAASERLGEAPLLSRAAPVERMFSRETAREILSFVVGANMAVLRAQAPGHEADP